VEEHQLERIQRILVQVEDCLARGEAPDLSGYFLRFPEIEEELRGEFRRRGLLADPFRDAAQYRRATPPWESAPAPSTPRAAGRTPSSAPSPGHSLERDLLLENLLRPAVRGDRRPFFSRRRRALLALALAFVLGWAALMVRERVSLKPSPTVTAPTQLEGLAALLAMAVGWPEAKADLLAEGAAEADRLIREGGNRWQVRWIRFLLFQGLERGTEASRELDAIPPLIARRLLVLDRPSGLEGESASEEIAALAALGDVAARGTERSRDLLPSPGSPELGRLLWIVRGASSPEARPEAGKALLGSDDTHTRLLGAAWGIGAGDPAARAALREMAPEDLATARMMVTLGEEEVFLRKSRPGRVDLAPLRIEALRKVGRKEEARRYAEEALTLGADSFELRLAAARLLVEEKDFARAAGHLRIATLLRTDSTDPMREWMRLAGDCPDRPELIAPCAELFLRRLSQETRDLLAYPAGRRSDGPGECLVAAGFGLPREEEARARAVGALLQAASARSSDPAMLFLLGRALFSTGRWAEAAARFEAAERAADPLDRPAIRPWTAAASRRAENIVEDHEARVVPATAHIPPETAPPFGPEPPPAPEPPATPAAVFRPPLRCSIFR
jgi:tetratricopeptide (TPR) repeat protein